MVVEAGLQWAWLTGVDMFLFLRSVDACCTYVVKMDSVRKRGFLDVVRLCKVGHRDGHGYDDGGLLDWLDLVILVLELSADVAIFLCLCPSHGYLSSGSHAVGSCAESRPCGLREHGGYCPSSCDPMTVKKKGIDLGYRLLALMVNMIFDCYP